MKDRRSRVAACAEDRTGPEDGKMEDALHILVLDLFYFAGYLVIYFDAILYILLWRYGGTVVTIMARCTLDSRSCHRQGAM